MKVPVTIYESVSLDSHNQLVDATYSSMVSIMETANPNKHGNISVFRTDGWRGSPQHRLTKASYGPFAALTNGMYYPASKRAYWCGNFDVGVDDFPDSGCVYCAPDQGDGESFAYVHVRKMGGFGADVFCDCKDPVAYYKTEHVSLHPLGMPHDPQTKISLRGAYFAVGSDGAVYTAHNRVALRDDCAWQLRDCNYQAFHWGPGALSLLSDRKYLWLVEVEESVPDVSGMVKIQFGVDVEFVKSLFFARDIPITATGRLKPILHWVSAHKRRIALGTDVDVSKHLRGVSEFVMCGFRMAITSPKKPAATA